MARIVVELTNRCNLKCQHCFSGRHGGNDDLPLEVLRKVLDEAADLGVDQLSFTGGDPTVCRHFEEAVRLTVEAGYAWSMVTNGFNFDRSHRVALAYREALKRITFSFEGATEATHDRLRGRGSYRRVLRAMSLCLALDIPFSNNMVVTRHNRHELKPLIELAAQLGSRGVRFGHLMPSPLTTAQGFDLSPAERREVEAEIRDLAARAPLPVTMAPGYHTEELFPCAPLQLQEMNLDVHGNLSKCCHLSGHGEGVGSGDVAGSLLELSFSEAYARLEEAHRAFRADKLAARDEGRLRDDDYFPCWHCSKHFDKVGWLKRVPGHAWADLLGA